jgi:hypothetical protein
MESLKLLLLSVAAAVVYGILQDQITARVCVEYFTIGHPDIFGTGVLLGVPLALVARRGSRPPLTADDLALPILLLIGCVGLLTLVAGIVGYFAARLGWVCLLEPLASRVPGEKHSAFLADLWAHSAAYLGGDAGGVVL